MKATLGQREQTCDDFLNREVRSAAITVYVVVEGLETIKLLYPITWVVGENLDYMFVA